MLGGSHSPASGVTECLTTGPRGAGATRPPAGPSIIMEKEGAGGGHIGGIKLFPLLPPPMLRFFLLALLPILVCVVVLVVLFIHNTRVSGCEGASRSREKAQAA